MAIILLVCGAGVVAVAVNIEPSGQPFVVGPASPTTGAKNSPPIVLEVTTTGKGNVSWNVNGQGGSDNGVTFPYRRELGPFDSNAVFVSMVAQDTTGKGGSLQGKITYGDNVYSCEGSGAYAVVTCTGTG
jgi:hypothetical protein